MTDEELAGVVELTLMRHFAAGEEVLREGAVAGQLIFIVKGFARATRATPEGPAEWAVLGAGSSLDVQAASALAPARYSVEATSALEAMLLPVRAGLLGERIVSRLHARELQPPEGDEILRLAGQAPHHPHVQRLLVTTTTTTTTTGGGGGVADGAGGGGGRRGTGASTARRSCPGSCGRCARHARAPPSRA